MKTMAGNLRRTSTIVGGINKKLRIYFVVERDCIRNAIYCDLTTENRKQLDDRNASRKTETLLFGKGRSNKERVEWLSASQDMLDFWQLGICFVIVLAICPFL